MSQQGKGSVKTALEKFIGADHTEPEEKAPSITNADLYIEEEPTVGEFLREITPSAHAVGEYFYNLFPFLSWVGKYNLIWFVGDMVAGKS
jgi:sodium-independent sulfate anion transporter 11